MKELPVFLNKHIKVHESACLRLPVYFKTLCSLEFPIKICIPVPDLHHHRLREEFMNWAGYMYFSCDSKSQFWQLKEIFRKLF